MKLYIFDKTLATVGLNIFVELVTQSAAVQLIKGCGSHLMLQQGTGGWWTMHIKTAPVKTQRIEPQAYKHVWERKEKEKKGNSVRAMLMKLS